MKYYELYSHNYCMTEYEILCEDNGFCFCKVNNYVIKSKESVETLYILLNKCACHIDVSYKIYSIEFINRFLIKESEYLKGASDIEKYLLENKNNIRQELIKI